MESPPEYAGPKGERILTQRAPERGSHSAYCYFGKHVVPRSDSEQVMISGLSLRICTDCLKERGL